MTRWRIPCFNVPTWYETCSNAFESSVLLRPLTVLMNTGLSSSVRMRLLMSHVPFAGLNFLPRTFLGILSLMGNKSRKPNLALYGNHYEWSRILVSLLFFLQGLPRLQWIWGRTLTTQDSWLIELWSCSFGCIGHRFSVRSTREAALAADINDNLVSWRP